MKAHTSASPRTARVQAHRHHAPRGLDAVQNSPRFCAQDIKSAIQKYTEYGRYIKRQGVRSRTQKRHSRGTTHHPREPSGRPRHRCLLLVSCTSRRLSRWEVELVLFQVHRRASVVRDIEFDTVVLADELDVDLGQAYCQ